MANRTGTKTRVVTLGFLSIALLAVVVTFVVNGEVPPQDGAVEKPTFERSLNNGKSFKIRTLRGEELETFFVTVAVQIQKADGLRFDKRYDVCKIEIIDRITTVLSASTDLERQEAGLITIKEKIKRALNDVLGTPWVQQVFFYDVSLESLEYPNTVSPALPSREGTVEIPLNEGKSFTVKTFRNECNEIFTVAVQFQINRADVAAFKKRSDECKYEIIDRVLSVLRASTYEERQEARLTAIKERIKQETNEVLGTPWVLQVFCSEISLEMQ
jgi:hypothetical protein